MNAISQRASDFGVHAVVGDSIQDLTDGLQASLV